MIVGNDTPWEEPQIGRNVLNLMAQFGLAPWWLAAFGIGAKDRHRWLARETEPAHHDASHRPQRTVPVLPGDR